MATTQNEYLENLPSRLRAKAFLRPNGVQVAQVPPPAPITAASFFAGPVEPSPQYRVEMKAELRTMFEK